jgi:putative transposase
VSREYKNVRNIRIKRNSLGEFFIYFVCDIQPNTFKTRSGAIGIDFGLKTYLMGSDNLITESPLFFGQHRKSLAKAQRKLSSKVKGSNNRHKAKKEVARIYKRIKHLRDNFQWKLAHELCSKYSHIFLEDIHIEGMKRLWGKKVSDLSHSAFISKLEYIATKYKTIVHKIDRYFPSSKQCFACGNIKKDLSLKDRIYICECGYSECRDEHAAKNILREGILSFERKHQTDLSAISVCIKESHAL